MCASLKEIFHCGTYRRNLEIYSEVHCNCLRFIIIKNIYIYLVGKCILYWTGSLVYVRSD